MLLLLIATFVKVELRLPLADTVVPADLSLVEVPNAVGQRHD